jgi:pimeloyl-ACP methyl ester carboxylesterase
VIQGQRVLRYDTRGTGLSEKIRSTVLIDTMTADLAARIDALGIAGPVAFAGVAVGAAIAMRFAARYEDRVTALVAMSPATGIPRERRTPTLSFADEIESKGMRAVADGMLTRSYPTPMRGNMERFNTLRAQLLANDPASLAAVYRMLTHLEMKEGFALITCPTLVIAGTHDGLRPPPVVEPVAQSLPNAMFKVHESGHAQQAQTPELVAAAINDHLEGVKAGRFQKTVFQKVGA